MQTRIDGISDGIYRLSTLVPEIAPPAGFVFNQFLEAEALFRSMSVTPETIATLDRLAGLAPKTLATMHGSSLSGDCAGALQAFAGGLAKQRLAA